MKLSFRSVFMLLVGFWIVSQACGDSSPPESEVARKKQPPDFSAIWPPESDEATPLAEDLLAANYYVVLDGSGSMEDGDCAGGKSKSDASKEALESFVAAIPPEANVGLLAFDQNGVRERLPLGAGNRERFVKEARATQPEGGTPLHKAIDMAYRSLVAQGRRQLGYGEYHLVVVTDGIASNGQDPTRIVDDIVRDSPVLVHTIGFCIGPDHSLNQPGRTLYREANNPQELRAGLQSVLAEAPRFDVTDF